MLFANAFSSENNARSCGRKFLKPIGRGGGGGSAPRRKDAQWTVKILLYPNFHTNLLPILRVKLEVLSSWNHLFALCDCAVNIRLHIVLAPPIVLRVFGLSEVSVRDFQSNEKYPPTPQPVLPSKTVTHQFTNRYKLYFIDHIRSMIISVDPHLVRHHIARYMAYCIANSQH